MGCLFSKSNRSPTRRTTQTTTGWSWEIEDKGEVTLQEGLTPEDFIYEGKESEYLVKEEGTLCGQQFSISSCKDCDVYLCDYSDSILIDSCDSCRMFIGPVSGSVFIRNCSNCKIVIASQQLRTRDSQDCDILLHCATQPVIEDSQNIRFGCFQYFYFGLKDHFNRAHLSVFDNVWYNIHNFTPNNASFEYLPEDTTAQDMLNSLSQFSSLVGEDEEFNIEMQLEGIPRTLDPYCREFPSKTMVIVFSGYYLNALSFLETIRSQTGGTIKLARSRESKIDEGSIINMSSKNLSKIKKQLAREPFVFLILKGDEESPQVLKEICQKQMSHEMFFVTSNNDDIQNMESIING